MGCWKSNIASSLSEGRRSEVLDDSTPASVTVFAVDDEEDEEDNNRSEGV
jgi:hypothetical protein